MAKTKISQYDATAANNTDIDSISIAEGMAPSNVNNAIRELMAHLKDMDAGTQALTSPQLTSVDINGGTIDGAVIGGNSAAAVTATSLSVDNITIDGTTIALSSGSLVLDSAVNIDLDADNGAVTLKDGGVHVASINMTSSDLQFYTEVANKDMKFSGNDNGAPITALTLDMSDRGAARFNANGKFFGQNLVNEVDCVSISYEGSSKSQIRAYSAAANIVSTLELQVCASDGSGSKLATLSNAGLTLSDGDLVIGTAGHGISFAATSDAGGMTSEILNDYEEGTFTGTLTSATPPSSPPTATGHYTKIGRSVTVSIFFEAVNTSGGSGGMSVTGLPFTAGSASGNRGSGAVQFYGMTFAGEYAVAEAAGTAITFRGIASNAAWTDLTITAGTTKFVQTTMTYTV